MKRYLALILSLWVGTVQAQMTLACQFMAGNGFIWKNEKWQPTMFNFRKPFFLTIRPDNQLEPKSALVAMALAPDTAEAMKSETDLVHCFPHFKRTNSSACADYSGSSITISLASLEGAVSLPAGATQQSQTRRDTMSISPFVCQKM